MQLILPEAGGNRHQNPGALEAGRDLNSWIGSEADIFFLIILFSRNFPGQGFLRQMYHCSHNWNSRWINGEGSAGLMKGHTGVRGNKQVLENRFVCFPRDTRNRLLQLVSGCIRMTLLLCGCLQISTEPAVIWNPGQPGKAEWEHILLCLWERLLNSSPEQHTDNHLEGVSVLLAFDWSSQSH